MRESWEDAGFGVPVQERWLKGFTGRPCPDGRGTFGSVSGPYRASGLHLTAVPGGSWGQGFQDTQPPADPENHDKFICSVKRKCGDLIRWSKRYKT